MIPSTIPSLGAVTPARQRGLSLLVSLVMLTVIAAMGVSAFVASNTQFRMAANLQFQNVATAHAESALAQAENWIATNGGPALAAFDTRVSGGLYPGGTAPDPLTMTWDDTTSVRVDTLGFERYTIERVDPVRYLPGSSSANCAAYNLPAACTRVYLYRLTARGVSVLGTTKVVQSVFAVRSL